jgi:bacterioferritin-associated ferredoxin
MSTPYVKFTSFKRTVACSWAAGAIAAFAPSPAYAHFLLQAPASYDTLDPTTGLPEKLGPCGNEAPQTLTNAVTAFQEGQSITITIDEVVFHPGHYRVALAMTPDHMQASFPDEPVVTPGLTNSGTALCPDGYGETSACGNVQIESPPVFPVLADDLFEHCVPFTEPQSATIKLPPGVNCSKCTVQVIEFMSDHGPNVPGGCFYHHCADVSIIAETAVVDGGALGEGGKAPSQAGSSSTGCSVELPSDSLSGGCFCGLGLALGLVGSRRRRRDALAA